MDCLMETGLPAVPAGMIRNYYGGFTPLSMVKPEHLLAGDVVRGLVEKAQALSLALAAFREASFSEVDAFLHLLAEKYEAPRGGLKGNTTLETFDALMRVQVATGDFLTFGPELQSAKALVDECLVRWTEDSGAEIKSIVADAFDVGKEGKIKVDRVLALRRLAIDDPTWVRAMLAISDAVRVTHSKRYIRFYTRKKVRSRLGTGGPRYLADEIMSWVKLQRAQKIGSAGRDVDFIVGIARGSRSAKQTWAVKITCRPKLMCEPPPWLRPGAAIDVSIGADEHDGLLLVGPGTAFTLYKPGGPDAGNGTLSLEVPIPDGVLQKRGRSEAEYTIVSDALQLKIPSWARQAAAPAIAAGSGFSMVGDVRSTRRKP